MLNWQFLKWFISFIEKDGSFTKSSKEGIMYFFFKYYTKYSKYSNSYYIIFITLFLLHYFYFIKKELGCKIREKKE
jgi:hypothetical protein